MVVFRDLLFNDACMKARSMRCQVSLIIAGLSFVAVLSACSDGGNAETLSPSTSATSFQRHQHRRPISIPNVIETAGGEIIFAQDPSSGYQILWWQGQKLMQDDAVGVLQTYPEKHGNPAILVINKNCNGSICGDTNPYIVDMGVSPPFISPDHLTIFIDNFSNPPKVMGLTIKKIDANTYSFSGKFFERDNQNYNGKDVTFIYSRLKKTIEEKK